MHKFRDAGRIVFFGVIGNIFEWYEFSLYAYFSGDIARQFFPHQDKMTALMNAFGMFAIGFLVRPLGAAVFGYFGDKLGRKQMLTTSLVMMASATAAIALIPGYHQIGSWAGIFLVICRMIQGFALGGEYSGSVVYLIEQAPVSRRGLWGSFTLFGAYFGMLLGSLVSAVVTHFAKDTSYVDSAWRLCFLLGCFLGILGMYIRSHLPETPAFAQAEAQSQLEDNPVKSILRFHSGALLKGVGITLLPAVTSYTIFSFMPTYLNQFSGVPLDQALFSNTVAMVVMLVAIPVVGFLSDLFPRKLFLVLSALGILCLAYPLFQLLLAQALHVQALLAVLSCCSEAVIPVILAGMFPTHLRYSGIAICLNVANGFFGGTAALVATYLISQTQNNLVPSFYLIAIAAISLLTTLFLGRQGGAHGPRFSQEPASMSC